MIKVTLLNKLLKFFIPLLIIPVLIVIVFYNNYVNSIITKEIIESSKKSIIEASNSIHIQKYLYTAKNEVLSDISIVDKDAKYIDTNNEYENTTYKIKIYIQESIENNNTKLYHDDENKFFIKAIVRDKKINSFIILNYKNKLEKKLATTKQTFIYIIFIVIFILFIIIIFIIVFSFQITSPLGELVDGIKIISSGDKSHKIEIKTDDEIAVLADTFNEMIVTINKHQENIELLNSSLEERVKEEVEKNREKDKQMIQQARLAQMGEMLSMIAHQWRQPLAAISSTSAGLELKTLLGKSDKELIIKSTKNISRYSQHLSTTIDDFRDFFKSEKIEKDVSYTEVIESVLNIIQVSIENKNIKLIKEFNTDDKFKTHPNELKQVIHNLVKNAEDILIEKALKDTHSHKKEEPYIKIRTYIEDNKQVLEVSDNGGGIPEDIIDKVFDPYFSTKLEKNGTGLGLYMSKTIIEEHCDGKLSVSNNKFGAVFKISIDKY